MEVHKVAKKLSQDLRQRFVELRAEGKPYSEISEELNVSKPTLIEWSRDLEDEILNLKAIYLDELYKKYYVAKQIRIELFGKRLETILNELDQRDLKEVTTDRLLEFVLKYISKLREEETSLLFKGNVLLKSFKDMDSGTWEA